MIKKKITFISGIVILGICMCLFFPYPNSEMIYAQSSFMSFPIQTKDGFRMLGIIGSVLFIVAIILIGRSITKYFFRTIGLVVILYACLPYLLITAYQETFASGIMAMSYNGDGTCDFKMLGKDLMMGECELALHNRSNEAVSFDLEFLESSYLEDDMRMTTLMNLAGPYHLTIEANRIKSIHLKEILDVTDVSNHMEGGASYEVHFKLWNGETERNL